MIKLIPSKIGLEFISNIRCLSYRSSSNNKFYTRSSLTARDILEHSHGETGSLTTRFIKHIALENCKFKNVVPKTVKYSQYYPLSNVHDFKELLKKTDESQLPQITIFTSTYKSNADPSNVADVITTIDNMCCDKISRMKMCEIFQNLYSFMYLIPNKITRLKFYKCSIKAAIEKFDYLQPKEIFVQMCYYLGLSKGDQEISKLMNTFLSEFADNYLTQLSGLDFAIISNAAYKNSITFNLDGYQDRLISETLSENIDDDLLITFIKSLRLNRIKSDKVIEKLNERIKKRPTLLDFKAICHIFAFFAENNYNDTTTCLNLANLSTKILQSLNPYNFVFNDVRPKDLATLIWSCAQLKISNLHVEDYKYFENIILQKIDRNEYVKYFDELVNTCLSLWMLNYKSSKLIKEVLKLRFSNDGISKKNQINQRVKLESRFNLLTNLVQIEPLEGVNISKNLLLNPYDENKPAPEYLCKNNSNLSNMYNLLVKNQKELNIQNVKIVQPILDINIPSILVKYEENKKFFIEILDESNKLRFNNEPHAFISLKIKTLQHLKQKTILIDVENLSSDYILEKIQNMIQSL